jgi:aminoglycoside 6'-N-acetyltransferase
MLSFRPLSAIDFPILLTWLCSAHVQQWWNDGDDTLEKVTLHYGAEEPDVARFILMKSTESGKSPIGYFQYYIVSKDIIGIDQFIGEAEYLNQGIGTAAIKLFLEMIVTQHQPQQIIIDPHPKNQRAIRCYEKVGFMYYATEFQENGESAHMMKLELSAQNPDTSSVDGCETYTN